MKAFSKFVVYGTVVFIISVVCWLITKNDWFFVINLFTIVILLARCYFYRDPERYIPDEVDIILAPADGCVTGIHMQKEPVFCQKSVIMISIFLRLWDVHINRMPVDGKIQFMDYKEGRFHPAFLKKAAEKNEQMMIGIENREGRFLIRQVAGMLARRIICTVKPGNHVKQGQKFGMIKLGSLVELAIPDTYRITIKKGQRVKAGETIIGVLESK